MEEPVVIYLALVLATALLLIEIALPTLGIAGGLAALLVALGVYGIWKDELVWWPLLLAAAGVCTWAVLLLTHRPTASGQIVAAVSFAVGSILFCVLADDVPALVAAIACSVALPATFPILQRQTRRLMDRPSDVGMESMVGKGGRVARWSGHEGSVMVDGTYWNAESDDRLEAGNRVVVDSFSGMLLHVHAATPSRSPRHRTRGAGRTCADTE